MKFYFLFLIIILSLSDTFAIDGEENKKGTELITIKGKVVDKSTGEGLAGVTVNIDGTNVTVYTDFEGNFEIPAIEAGNYKFIMKYISYRLLKIEKIFTGSSQVIFKMENDLLELEKVNKLPVNLNSHNNNIMG